MVALASKIKELYPLANLGVGGNVVVIDDGVNQYISYWDTDALGEQPTKEQLDAVANIVAQKQTVASLTLALESHYDTTAKERRYDNRYTCALRAGYAGPFQAEGLAFALWMDTCNALGYQVMAECQAGTRAIPTAEELIAMMPEMVWP